MRVGIDAGHGGTNHGIEANGIIEKDWTYSQANVIFNLLASLGVSVTMLRSGDETVSLKERAARADEFGCDVVVSLHVNAGDPLWHGLRALHYPLSRDGRRLADAVARKFPSELSSPSTRSAYPAKRDSWPDAHAVLGAYSQPTVLVEYAFATHGSDSIYLKDLGIVNRANLAIVAALLDY